jgi:hypothetical protein
MCSNCNAGQNLSTEDRHRLIRLEEQMTRYELNWLDIEHRVISLTARLHTEADKPKNEQDIVEIARLSRNLSAAKLDQGNVILDKAKVAAQMMQIIDDAKKPKPDSIDEFIEKNGFKPLSPDDPMYKLINGLVGGLGDTPGFTLGQPLVTGERPSGSPFRPFRGPGGFSPTAGEGFGFPM